MKLFGSRKPKSLQGYSVIDDRLTIRGELDTDGTVRVDGRIEGATHRIANLVVGPRGGVFGNVEAVDVIVAGMIEGNVRATGRIEIEEGAAVHGDIRANAMTLREGAAVHGQVSIGAATAVRAAHVTPVVQAAIHPPAGRHLEIAASSSAPRAAG